MIDDKAKVSLTKVTVNSSPQDLSSSGFILVREASLTINSGNYVSKDYGFVNCSRGTFTVKGGTFSECAFNRYGFRPDKSKLLITGGRFSAGNDQYNQKYGIIRNGSFSDVTIKGGTLTNPNGPVIEKRSDENLRIYNAVLRIPGGTITEKQDYSYDEEDEE